MPLPCPFLATGVAEVDAALAIGGLPCGAITEFVGENSTGKSWLALHAIASAQQQGKACLLLDTEGAHHPSWLRRNGVNPDALIIAQPDSLNAARAIIDEALFNKLCDLLVIDSLHGLAPSMPHSPITLRPHSLTTSRPRTLTALYNFLPHLQTLAEGSGAACLITNHLGEIDGVPTSFANDLMRRHAAVRAVLSLESESLEGIDVRFQVKRNNLVPHLGESIFHIAF